VRRAALLVAAAAITLAYGRKNRPLPPELVRPEPPEQLAAITTSDGVRLTWLRPLHYSGGHQMNDLGGFRVDRAAGETGPPDFHEIATVPVNDRDRFRKERHIEWVDKDVTPGTRYVYRVTAYTLDNYRSESAGPVAVRFGPSPEPRGTKTP
jgi:hypothetical protein